MRIMWPGGGGKARDVTQIKSKLKHSTICYCFSLEGNTKDTHCDRNKSLESTGKDAVPISISAIAIQRPLEGINIHFSFIQDMFFRFSEDGTAIRRGFGLAGGYEREGRRNSLCHRSSGCSSVRPQDVTWKANWASKWTWNVNGTQAIKDQVQSTHSWWSHEFHKN